MEIRKTRTTARNPRCNGQTKRFNSTLIRMLKCFIQGQHNEWDRYLGCLAGAYRASVHESTNFTPNRLMLGREVRVPAEIKYSSLTHKLHEQASGYGEYVEKLMNQMKKAHVLTRKYLGAAVKRQKCYYDVKATLHKFSEGDAVWYLSENRKEKQSAKFQMAYEGPYLVVHKVSDLDFCIELNKEDKRKVVHYNTLKPYGGSHFPAWGPKAVKKYTSCASGTLREVTKLLSRGMI